MSRAFRIAQEEATILIHKNTLANPKNIKSGFHRENVEASLADAEQRLKKLKEK